jgi:hypothetical protein
MAAASNLTEARAMVPCPIVRRLGVTALIGAFSCFGSAIVDAQRTDIPSAERARGAEQVVVGHVSDVTPVWSDNDFGDRLIVSVVHVVVEETLKGSVPSAVDVEIEGGTIGSLTLRVSDLDPLVRGDRAVFYLQRNRRGRVIPHLRGLGLQKLDSTNHVRGSNVTLDQVRRDVRAGAGR